MIMTSPSAVSTARASVDVSLGDRSYGITIGEGLLKHAGEMLLPMLKDLKQATDTAIEQGARRR